MFFVGRSPGREPPLAADLNEGAVGRHFQQSALFVADESTQFVDDHVRRDHRQEVAFVTEAVGFGLGRLGAFRIGFGPGSSHNAISSPVLRGIQAFIGSPEHAVDRVARFGLRNTERRGDLPTVHAFNIELADGQANPVGPLGRLGEIGPRTENDKLFSAIPAHDFARIGLVLQQLGEFDQYLVTHGVAERIVHVFEVVDVGKNHTERLGPVGFDGSGDEDRQLRFQLATIADARQCVAGRGHPQLVVFERSPTGSGRVSENLGDALNPSPRVDQGDGVGLDIQPAAVDMLNLRGHGDRSQRRQHLPHGGGRFSERFVFLVGIRQHATGPVFLDHFVGGVAQHPFDPRVPDRDPQVGIDDVKPVVEAFQHVEVAEGPLQQGDIVVNADRLFAEGAGRLR